MNSQFAIRAEGLSKKYRLGVMADTHPTLRETFARAASRLARLRAPEAEARRSPREHWALRDVSFEVKRGEVLGIIGPNGAGKSTILKILAGIVEPTAGRVMIRGRLGALLEVGTGFHPELTGRENVFLNGTILGMRRREVAAKFDEIIDFAGVGAFLDTPVKRYSSGMYLRLAFAVAAHVDPDILIVDEVLAVGDAAFQKKCIRKAESLAMTGRTVLVVSHQMPVLQQLCTRAILIEGGRVRADGPASEVVRNYLATLDRRAQTNLSDRLDRSGRGNMRIVGIEIVGRDGPVISGGPATIRLQVDGPRAPAQCMVSILNDIGEVVTTFDTADISVRDVESESFQIHVEAMLLRPGEYRLDAALIADDRVVEDHVESAAIFEVQPGLIDGRAALQSAGFGSVVLPYRWYIRR